MTLEVIPLVLEVIRDYLRDCYLPCYWHDSGDDEHLRGLVSFACLNKHLRLVASWYTCSHALCVLIV